MGTWKKCRKVLSSALAIGLAAGLFNGMASPSKVSAAPNNANVVISQIYGGGGNSGATYTNDFIELYNPTDHDIDLSDWSVQYTSASGTSFSVTSIPSGKSIPSHGYFLIEESKGSGGTKGLDSPDVTGGTLAMAAAAGQVALVSSTAKIANYNDAAVVDFVGFGGASKYEGSGPAPAPSNTLAVVRKDAGNGILAGYGSSRDTDDNANDFAAHEPNPRNSSVIQPLFVPSETSQTSSPIGKNIQLLADEAAGKSALTGFASAAATGAEIKVYDSSAAIVLARTTADSNGAFSVSIDGAVSSVAVTSAESGKTESIPTIINAASPLPPVTIGSYIVDSNGQGTVKGTAYGASVQVSVYGDAGLTMPELGAITSGNDGSFSISFPSAPDQVYVTQVMYGDNGRSLPSSPVSATKEDLSGTRTIASIRAVDDKGVPTYANQTVTVDGVATIDNNVIGSGYSNLYIQDETGGINLYGGYDHKQKIVQGDLLHVTGKLTNYNGLLELQPSELTVVSHANAIPQPKGISISDLNDYAQAEPLEGQLVTIQAKIDSVAAPDSSGVNVTALDPANAGKKITIRVPKNATTIDAASDFVVGKTYTVTGIVGQYDSSSPYTSGYEVFPRGLSDIAVNLAIAHTQLTQAYSGADVTISAQVDGATSVTLYYRKDSSASYAPVSMTSSDNSTYAATIPAAALEGLDGFDYYIEATSGEGTQKAGDASAPYHVELVSDQLGPVVSSPRPGDGETAESYNPTISAILEDPSGIDSATMTVDSQAVDAKVTAISATKAMISYTPAAALQLGQHTVTVSAKDLKGNLSDKTWTFTAAEPFTGGNHYRGTTHDHTMYSHDATGTPEAAIASAKKYGFDWIAITDHSHDIDANASNPDSDTVMHGGQPERTGGAEWQNIKQAANEGTVNGQFVAIPSFEMTSTIWGHSNVFGTDNFIDRLQENKYYNSDYNTYYKWLETYGSNAIAVFNHPDWPNVPYGNFAPYDAAADLSFSMIEVGNGSGHYSYSNTESKYYRALDMGWHVAPVYGEDNHDESWGQTMKRTVVVAKELTRDSLYDSMKNMHVYMSEDPNFQLDMFANGSYMGATVGGSTIKFDISGQDPVQENASIPEYSFLPASYAANDNIAKVEIISNGGKAIKTYTPTGNETNFRWQPEINVGSQAWYVVKVTQKDGDRIYSAPIWSEAVAVDAKVTSVSVTSGVVVAGTAATVQAEIGNSGLRDLTDVKLALYEDVVDEAHRLGEQKTYATLAAGATATLVATWTPATSGNHNLIAVIDPIDGDNPEDNIYTQAIEVKQPLGITVLIDAAHKNENTTTDSGSYANQLKTFAQVLSAEGYSVRESTTALTADALKGVKILVLTHPATDLTADENAAVAAFVQNGGSLLLTDKSNYGSNPSRANQLLQAVGSNIRVNNDGIFDDSPEGNFWSNQLYKFAVRLHIKPNNSMITDRISSLEYYSGASLIASDGQALTDRAGLKVLAWGNATTYQDSVANGQHVYHLASDQNTDGSTIPAIAVEQVGQGRIFVSGMNVFNDQEMDATDLTNGNDVLALNVVDWLAGREAKVSTIAEARALPVGSNAVVEGTVTSSAGVFFDAFYIQDSTGGIMAYKEVPEGSVHEGDTVRIYGHISEFENNKELEFDAFDLDVIKTGATAPVQPRHITTGQATQEVYQGQLVSVKGKVTAIYDDNSYIINDGTGDALVFTDGYIVNQGATPVPKLAIGDTLEAVGFVGKFSDGYRIRVRSTSELIGTVASPGTGDGGSGENGNNNNNNDNNDNTGNTGNAATDEDLVKVTPDMLKNNGSGKAVVELPAKATSVQLPSNAGELLSQSSLEVKKDGIEMEIPAGLLKQLANKVTAQALQDSSIRLQINSLSDSEAQNLITRRQGASSSVRISGPVYDFSLSIVSANGTTAVLTQFDEPITLRLKVGTGVNPDLAAVYYVADNGELEFIGGRLEGSEMVAKIKHFSKYAVLEVTKKFDDLPANHWAYTVIQKLAAQGIVNGTSADAFEPARQINRAEFVALLVKALQLTDKGQEAAYEDVDPNAWYATAISIASEAGIVKGKDSNTFDPKGAVTREEMAVMLMNAYGLRHEDGAASSEASFKDAGKVASWAVESVKDAAALHLVNGRTDGKFDPKGFMTRAEAAQAIYNLLQIQ